jgi:transcription-repair coupling factor (superfamily II helicase)
VTESTEFLNNKIAFQKLKDNFLNTINKLSSLKYIDELGQLIRLGKKDISVKNLSGSLGSLTIAGLWNREKRSFFIITYNNKEAEEWYHNLTLFFGKDKVALLTAPQKNVKFETESLDRNFIWLIEGLANIRKNEDSIIITTPGIFEINIPKSDHLRESIVKLKTGDKLNFEDITRTLLENGFDRKDFVESQGDIAIRGGIVDIFPIGNDNPLRFEFWGNEIESIREFDTLSQRSIRKYDEIEFLSSVFDMDSNDFSSNITEYIHESTVMVLDSPEMLQSEFENIDIPNTYQTLNINKIGQSDITIKSLTQPQFHGSVQQLCNEIANLCSIGSKVILCAEGEIHSERFRDLIEHRLFDGDNNTELIDFFCTPEKVKNSIIWLDETVTDGFILPDYNLAIFTEHQVFDRVRFQSKSRKKTTGLSLKELKQLNINDYVVHVDKGIAKFNGFEKVKMGGSTQDCVKLSFAGGDTLFINLNYIHKIQKYSSQEGVLPQLSKLGTREWERKKARTKKRLKDIARDLIKLYAQRKMSPGFSFPDDTMWQKEFEASFIYEDTPDQAQTTGEVKKDMQDLAPMDRLVCGDVGFGKTEIAIRAAFKAIQAGKQVAVLVPTTILGEQHFMTFRDRLEKYPVNIEAISRFRKKKKQTEIVDGVKKGQVDVLIGTHRLLSKDIEFKDLGLLVIDEEHRFGVGAKEKLRQLKVNVDTLTLTATPIPRTLNFSLMGARDLSIIETPPRNRLPVFTEILEWKDDTVQEAILKEVERKGQVFFVSDRVQDLEDIMLKLQAMMSTVKFGLAHGQMKNSELERVMEKFIEGKYDVLVTTKIVESGLDIPNANTIIINRANNFGLAELYQLRGRVGRSNTQAYCYLITAPFKTISTTAIKRLQAVEEFTELGSGFQLAMRDMEIRGAGNLLGPEQSGYINEIGFELFHRILDDVVQELRREEFSDLFKDTEYATPKMFSNEELEIQIDSDALLPSDYIESDTERFMIYKKLYNLRNITELNDFIEEMVDKFGKLPEKAEELINVVKLRIAALDTGFRKVILKKNEMVLEFPPESNTEYYDQAFPSISEFIKDINNAKLEQTRKSLLLNIPINTKDEAIEILWRIKGNIKALFG